MQSGACHFAPREVAQIRRWESQSVAKEALTIVCGLRIDSYSLVRVAVVIIT